MKKANLLLFLILLSSFANAQHFELDSDQVKVGDVYVSNPKIAFNYGNWTISNESYAQLDSIVQFLVKNSRLVIEIGVHTDSRGSDNYSIRLDQRRAESIRDYLIIKGIDSQRLSAKGYDDSELIISDTEIEKMKTAQEKEEAHAINRRTEFKILAIK